MLFQTGSRRISKRTDRLVVRCESRFGTGVSDRRVDGAELREVFAEHRRQLFGLLVVRFFVGPGLARIENVGRHSRDLGWNGKTENFVLARLRVVELPGESC